MSVRKKKPFRVRVRVTLGLGSGELFSRII